MQLLPFRFPPPLPPNPPPLHSFSPQKKSDNIYYTISYNYYIILLVQTLGKANILISFQVSSPIFYMALLSHNQHYPQPFLCVILFLIFKGVLVSGATFTFMNKCDYTVWPGIYGRPELGTTGFELAKGTSRTFQAPTGWSGRFWGRTGCQFDDSGHGTCSTADCGSGEIACNGATASPPATLAEFTLGTGSMDFYDVSLVDGYNLPMLVATSGGTGPCDVTGCSSDLNKKCPSELRVDDGGACNSACGAFGKPEYCCNGAFSNPDTCKPSVYSQMFKSECPKAYSYAYDDKTSTFTCSGADYTITFCPFSPSLKSAADSSTKNPNETDSSASGADPNQSEMASASYLADMAIASGASTRSITSMVSLLLVVVGFIFTIFYV